MLSIPYDLVGKVVPWVAISVYKNYLFKTNLISVMVYFIIVGFMAQCHYFARDIRSITDGINFVESRVIVLNQSR